MPHNIEYRQMEHKFKGRREIEPDLCDSGHAVKERLQVGAEEVEDLAWDGVRRTLFQWHRARLTAQLAINAIRGDHRAERASDTCCRPNRVQLTQQSYVTLAEFGAGIARTRRRWCRRSHLTTHRCSRRRIVPNWRAMGGTAQCEKNNYFN